MHITVNKHAVCLQDNWYSGNRNGSLSSVSLSKKVNKLFFLTMTEKLTFYPVLMDKCVVAQLKSLTPLSFPLPPTTFLQK